MTALEICQRCHTPYEWTRSQSALRKTYCGVLCEQAALGFSIDGLIRAQLERRPAQPHHAVLPTDEHTVAQPVLLLLQN